MKSDSEVDEMKEKKGGEGGRRRPKQSMIRVERMLTGLGPDSAGSRRHSTMRTQRRWLLLQHGAAALATSATIHQEGPSTSGQASLCFSCSLGPSLAGRRLAPAAKWRLSAPWESLGGGGPSAPTGALSSSLISDFASLPTNRFPL